LHLPNYFLINFIASSKEFKNSKELTVKKLKAEIIRFE